MQDTPEASEHTELLPHNSRRDKIRAAWISFVGRIVAQVVGATASVILGVMILQQYQRNPAPAVPVESTTAPVVARVARAPSDGAVSLAVLPLNSYSPDPGDEYFADSMTEALVADLAKVEGLRVISRTSTMRYKAVHKSIPEIAHELNVHMIVEGSIVKTRDRVRVTAQLIDGKSDEHVWAGSHDRTIDDLLALQAELASAIAQQVRGALNHTHQDAVYLAQSPSVPRP